MYYVMYGSRRSREIQQITALTHFLMSGIFALFHDTRVCPVSRVYKMDCQKLLEYCIGIFNRIHLYISLYFLFLLLLYFVLLRSC